MAGFVGSNKKLNKLLILVRSFIGRRQLWIVM